MTFPIIPASTVSGDYRISRSLRFRSSASAYLSRTFGTPTNQNVYTLSMWLKRGKLSSYNSLFARADEVTLLQFLTTDDFVGYQAGTNIGSTTSVYRDPSAWYHFVFTCSSATAQTLYVNGVQVKTYTTTNRFNASGVTHLIGARNGPSEYLDGYLAEVNFIDGQALTPSSFGAFDTNGVWQPKAYTGTYGTNGFYLPFTLNSTTAYSASFNGSTQYLAATAPSSFGTNALTVECFGYISGYPATIAMLVDTRSTDTNGTVIYINSSGILYFGSGSNFSVSSGKTLAIGTWYHLALTRTGGTTTIWLNGVSAGTTSDSSSLASTQIRIGTNYTNSYSFNGYLSNVRIVNGTAVYTASFIPPTNNLTAITNTQLLTLQSSTIVDNSSNALTITNNGSVTITSGSTPFAAPTVSSDSSGNANNWATNNINVTSSGTTYDSMIDSPTNYADGGNGRGNYAVLNPIGNPNGPITTYSSGNLDWANAGSAGNAPKMTVISTIGLTTGKWYFEQTPGSNVNQKIGFCNAITVGSARGTSYFTYVNDGTTEKSTGITFSGTPATYTTNNVIGVAIDIDAGTATFYKDGVSQATVSGIPAGTWFAYAEANASASASGGSFNFGQRPFSYTPPSGYSALNTQNLPTPTIAAGNKHFDATIYGGTGSTNPITNSGSFQPDLVWIRNRGAASGGMLLDAVRTSSVFLQTTNTNGDGSNSGDFVSFNPAGFSVGGNGNLANASSNTYVGWQWKAGGTGVTNTSGSITSTVSANTSAGFSIAQFTATGSNATVGHGLGVVPSMVIVKDAASAGNWAVWHTSLTSGTYYLFLNTTAAQANTSAIFTAAPSSTVVSIGTWHTADRQIMYCFAPVAGYSAFGSYTGNGSTDGPFIYTGFRPRWVLYKRIDSTGDWAILDTSRSTYNVQNDELYPNSSIAETAAGAPRLDSLSNGFKIRNGGGAAINASGGTYIYAAFAENPFKISRAR